MTTSTNGQTPELSAKQNRLLLAMLACGEVKIAAQAASVSYPTAKRWAREEHFRAALRAAQQECLAAAQRLLSDSALRAATVLRDLLGSESERTRLRASVEVLRRLENVGLEELSQKLEALEAREKGEPPLRPWAG
jgi:hypothetical protein